MSTREMMLDKAAHLFPFFHGWLSGKRVQDTGQLNWAPYLLCIFMLGVPSEVLAVQVHGPPEGLYVHQMAHLFFGAAMVFLLWILARHPLGHGPAWKYLKWSLFFFLLWNINALIVHSLDVHLAAEAVIRTPDFWDQRLAPPINMEKWIYFITKHDHVWCVPAMCFLVMSLWNFCKETEKKLKVRKGESR